MKIGIFGGSFDPVHTEHVRYVAAAKRELGLDTVIVVPSYVAPHKSGGAVLDGKARATLLKIAFRDMPYVRISEYELDAGGTSYTYLTCRKFRGEYRQDELYFLVGADMLENFFSWRQPEDILKNVTLAVCGRGAERCEKYRERFRKCYGKDFVIVPFTGADVSSGEIRLELFFGKKPMSLDPAVYEYVAEQGFYSDKAVSSALALETSKRREHSFRVAKLAVARAESVGVDKRKALYAAALHDCAKNLSIGSTLLKGFELPEDVPSPVAHQYAGAYLAEKIFGIKDEEILNAVRYHASGREGMSQLEKLVYLADLLEEQRDFPAVDELRAAFWRDLDECLYLSLLHQLEYLRSVGSPVYALTDSAYEWIKEKIKSNERRG